MENYKEMLINEISEMDLTNVDLENANDLVKEVVDEITFEQMDADDIIRQTAKDALAATALIAAGLAVTHITCKYVIPFAMKKVEQFKQKREQAKYEKSLTVADSEKDE